VESIDAERFELVPMTAAFIEAVLEDRRPDAEAIASVKLPDDWPDEHDRRFLGLRLRDLRERPGTDGWYAYAAVRPDEDRTMIGFAGFHGPPGRNAREEADAVELGYTIFAPYRGQGYATEAVRALVRWASEEHGIRRFLASVGPDNDPSLAIVRKLGFREIGRHWDDEDGEELEFELRLP
jgi:RimJ/RimL family protein N-acetyltransferase